MPTGSTSPCPHGGWDAFVADAGERLARRRRRRGRASFGHLADGNIHVEVIGPAADDERVDEIVLRCVADHGGSISAEHGVGRAKAAYLTSRRSAAEIAAMRAVKQALDPQRAVQPRRPASDVPPARAPSYRPEWPEVAVIVAAVADGCPRWHTP